MIDGILRVRLTNWGLWLNDGAHIAPRDARCISIESKCVSELGDVWAENRESRPTTNAADAEAIERDLRAIQDAGWVGVMERYCLAVRYAGYAAVFRRRRVGAAAMEKLADNCETMLEERKRLTALYLLVS